MASPTLDPGGLVQVRRDGPVMVVSSVVGELAYCYWYEGEALRQGSFLASRLLAVEHQRRTWAGDGGPPST